MKLIYAFSARHAPAHISTFGAAGAAWTPFQRCFASVRRAPSTRAVPTREPRMLNRSILAHARAVGHIKSSVDNSQEFLRAFQEHGDISAIKTIALLLHKHEIQLADLLTFAFIFWQSPNDHAKYVGIQLAQVASALEHIPATKVLVRRAIRYSNVSASAYRPAIQRLESISAEKKDLEAMVMIARVRLLQRNTQAAVRLAAEAAKILEASQGRDLERNSTFSPYLQLGALFFQLRDLPSAKHYMLKGTELNPDAESHTYLTAMFPQSSPEFRHHLLKAASLGNILSVHNQGCLHIQTAISELRRDPSRAGWNIAMGMEWLMVSADEGFGPSKSSLSYLEDILERVRHEQSIWPSILQTLSFGQLRETIKTLERGFNGARKSLGEMGLLVGESDPPSSPIIPSMLVMSLGGEEENPASSVVGFYIVRIPSGRMPPTEDL
ncbi:MAG: hypothetical protein M1829_005728 [Trizodia sp. TS-e1964]|nr:MAG: hypothetical protein M1829_005728 [Trizodia sp. TS-e1964]